MQSLKELIVILKESDTLQGDPVSIKLLDAIQPASEDDKECAYLLGCYFKNIIDPDILGELEKEALITTITELHLRQYYYLRVIPDFRMLDGMSYFFSIGGLVAVVGGVIQLVHGTWRMGYSSRYMVRTVSGGGLVVFIGLMLSISGIARLRASTRKSKLLKTLSKKRAA